MNRCFCLQPLPNWPRSQTQSMCMLNVALAMMVLKGLGEGKHPCALWNGPWKRADEKKTPEIQLYIFSEGLIFPLTLYSSSISHYLGQERHTVSDVSHGVPVQQHPLCFRSWWSWDIVPSASCLWGKEDALYFKVESSLAYRCHRQDQRAWHFLPM